MVLFFVFFFWKFKYWILTCFVSNASFSTRKLHVWNVQFLISAFHELITSFSITFHFLVIHHRKTIVVEIVPIIDDEYVTVRWHTDAEHLKYRLEMPTDVQVHFSDIIEIEICMNVMQCHAISIQIYTACRRRQRCCPSSYHCHFSVLCRCNLKLYIISRLDVWLCGVMQSVVGRLWK